MGVALGTAVPYLLLNVGIIMPVASRLVGVPVRAFAVDVCLPTMIASVPALCSRPVSGHSSPQALSGDPWAGRSRGTALHPDVLRDRSARADRERYLKSLSRHIIDGPRPTAAVL